VNGVGADVDRCNAHESAVCGCGRVHLIFGREPPKIKQHR
jgi:hypothetical protein